MKFKIALLVALLSFAPSSHAEEEHKGGISCHTKVLSSVCGTGTVDLIMNQHGGFELNYGDSSCWGMSVRYLGDRGLSSARPVGYNTKVLDLTASIDDTYVYKPIARTQVATAEYDPTNNVVLLKIDKRMFGNARGDTYHLQCEGKLQ